MAPIFPRFVCSPTRRTVRRRVAAAASMETNGASKGSVSDSRFHGVQRVSAGGCRVRSNESTIVASRAVALPVRAAFLHPWTMADAAWSRRQERTGEYWKSASWALRRGLYPGESRVRNSLCSSHFFRVSRMGTNMVGCESRILLQFCCTKDQTFFCGFLYDLICASSNRSLHKFMMSRYYYLYKCIIYQYLHINIFKKDYIYNNFNEEIQLNCINFWTSCNVPHPRIQFPIREMMYFYRW